MTIAWVLGSGGLLGAALSGALRRGGTERFIPAERFSWGDGSELDRQIAAAVDLFAVRCAGRRWEIYWAAGVGTMSSSSEAFVPETRALSSLLRLLDNEPRLMATSGAFAFASSAGAIYAGASDEIISENTAPTPTTDYAREKLLQEDMVRTFANANSRTSALVARISTLYGPGQAAEKRQGLMTHIARSIVRNQPIQIYVPYDTIRDYITADDAAMATIAATRGSIEHSRVRTAIVASEHPTTIAEIVSIFKRVARRKPRIVTSASRLSGLYARRVQFRSNLESEHPISSRTPLTVGIAQLMAAERALFVRGRKAETY